MIRLPDASTTYVTIKPANLWATSVRSARSRPVTRVFAERKRREREREREREERGTFGRRTEDDEAAAITDYDSDNNNIVRHRCEIDRCYNSREIYNTNIA